MCKMWYFMLMNKNNWKNVCVCYMGDYDMFINVKYMYKYFILNIFWLRIRNIEVMFNCFIYLLCR